MENICTKDNIVNIKNQMEPYKILEKHLLKLEHRTIQMSSNLH